MLKLIAIYLIASTCWFTLNGIWQSQYRGRADIQWLTLPLRPWLWPIVVWRMANWAIKWVLDDMRSF